MSKSDLPDSVTLDAGLGTSAPPRRGRALVKLGILILCFGRVSAMRQRSHAMG